MRAIYFLIIAFLLSSCEKIEYYPDKELALAPTLTLAHRGGGHDTLRENSYEACVYSLGAVDGIEVDIQMSKDKTIWLSHSDEVYGCGYTIGCFVEVTDEIIESIDSCNGNDISYTKLEDVFRYMDQNNIRKYVSLDLKGWAPCHGSSLNVEAIMRVEVEEAIKLAQKYNLEEYIIFETQLPSVLTWVKEKSTKAKAYYTSFGDYEKGMITALDNGFDGISFKSNFKDTLNADMINLLHKKGLRLMAWNIPDSAALQKLEDINVDMVQVDL